MTKKQGVPVPIQNVCPNPKCESVYFDFDPDSEIWSCRVCGTKIMSIKPSEMKCANCDITRLITTLHSALAVEALSCHFCAGCVQHLGLNNCMAANNWRPIIPKRVRR